MDILFIFSIIKFEIVRITFRKTTVVKNWTDNIQRTIAGNTAINCNRTEPITNFPSYPGLTLVACVGGYGNGESGLLVSGNKWVYNSNSSQKTFESITWCLIYNGTEE